MKKTLIPLLIASLFTTPLLQGEPPTEEAATEETTSQYAEVTPVGQASLEGTRRARNQQWTNIAMAAGAIAAAVTAVVLVGNHHHSHNH